MSNAEYDEQFFGRMRDYLSDQLDWFGMEEDNTVECLMEAFEAAKNPPKPDEPQGLGAVVEDTDGKRWIRTDVDQPAWSAWGNPIGRWSWSRIDAVRILNDGWEGVS